MTDPPQPDPVYSDEDPPSSLSELFERVRSVSRRINERIRKVAPDDTQPDVPAIEPEQPD
jgi:hypothetical protein